MKSRRKFFYNAFMIASSALAIRSIGVVFGVYVSNQAGAEAMGLFSLVMSVFGFALTVATSGVNLAVTRMISEALGKNDPGLLRKSMRKCIEYSMFFSIVSGVVLFVFAEYIGSSILKDTRTVFSLRILAVALPFISLTSAFNGYFTAVRRVFKNALCQILEQFIKIGFTVFLFQRLLQNGIEYACISLVAADTISEFSAFFISGILYLLDERKFVPKKSTGSTDKVIKKQLYSIALPVAFSAYIRSGLLTIEHILIPRELSKSGFATDTALASYGMLHGMVMPIILFPTAILASFAGLLIPELSECAVKNEKAQIQKIVIRALRCSILFSLIISGFFICFSDELGRLLYSSSEVGKYIRLIAPLIPVMYLDSVTDAMLKGLGEQVYSMNVNIIDALLSIILVTLLLPSFGINGYIMTIYTTELINASLSIVRLLTKTEAKPKILKILVAPLFCIIGAVSVGRIFFNIVDFSLGLKEQVIICGSVILIVYLVFVRITQTVSKNDCIYLKSIFRSH